jgi:transposase-like protein
MYKRHRFPREIIQYSVWLCHQFNLSQRDIDDLLAQRGIEVSYLTMVQLARIEVCSPTEKETPRVWRYVLH